MNSLVQVGAGRPSSAETVVMYLFIRRRHSRLLSNRKPKQPACCDLYRTRNKGQQALSRLLILLRREQRGRSLVVWSSCNVPIRYITTATLTPRSQFDHTQP